MGVAPQKQVVLATVTDWVNEELRAAEAIEAELERKSELGIVEGRDLMMAVLSMRDGRVSAYSRVLALMLGEETL